MSSETNMNIVLGQGNAIKEVHNVKKQNLELNQQFVAQKAEEEKEEDKAKVQESESGDRIEIKSEEEERKGKDPKEGKKHSKKQTKEEENNLSEGNLIDIKV